MKIPIIAFTLTLLLSGCSLGNPDYIDECGKSKPIYQNGKFIRCEGDENRTLTGSSPQISAEIIIKPKERVLTESDYVAKINLLNLGTGGLEDIVQNVLKHKVIQQTFSEDMWTREFYEKPLRQGTWKAIYNSSEYPSKKYDSMTITMSGKSYTFPGIAYKKETIAEIEKMKKEGVDRPEMYATSFGGFHSFSPSGKYILYTINGWESTQGYALEISTGRISQFIWQDARAGKMDGIQGNISVWTPDKTRFIFGEIGVLNITRKDAFPRYDDFAYELSYGRDVSDQVIAQYFFVDNTYAYTLTEYQNYYYLNIIDLKGEYLKDAGTYKYKGVYSGMVRKEMRE